MKPYTDLEQSKKLAEILPIESADMSYTWDFDDEQYYISTEKFSNWRVPKYAESAKHKQVIPCWSLAALLEEIPEVINFDDDESDYALEISKENDLYYLSYGNPFEHDKLEVEPQDNFVDACYEMIIKLHEEKLL